mmetsp:Transcript_67447/g.147812  ORF Transcript_67447/g.147812 Transcript_67447/m.147812 type:complete len:215 (-) Transcript_67447:799-1443(-)
MPRHRDHSALLLLLLLLLLHRHRHRLHPLHLRDLRDADVVAHVADASRATWTIRSHCLLSLLRHYHDWHRHWHHDSHGRNIGHIPHVGDICHVGYVGHIGHVCHVVPTHHLHLLGRDSLNEVVLSHGRHTLSWHIWLARGLSSVRHSHELRLHWHLHIVCTGPLFHHPWSVLMHRIVLRHHLHLHDAWSRNDVRASQIGLQNARAISVHRVGEM